jgi:hypothetical protein
MKLATTLLAVMLLLNALTFAAGPVITPVVSPTQICQGDTLTVSVLTSDTFATGNIFSIQLSDSSGSFANPVVLDTVVSQGNDTVSFLAPVVTKNSGNYLIRVVASDSVVGIDSTYLTIHQTPVVGFQLPQPSYCSYAYAVPLLGGSPAGGTYSGNYVFDSAFHAYLSDTGTFEVYYTYTDSIGCYAEDSTAINIGACPSPSVSVQVNPAALCPGGIMNINIQTSGVLGSNNVFTVQLSDSSGNFTNPTVLAIDTNPGTSTIQIPTPVEPAGADYQVRVIASNPATVSVAFGVSFKTQLSPPAVSLNTGGPVSLCARDTFILKANSLPGIAYQWSFNDVPFTHSGYTYAATDSGLYTLSYTDTLVAGCSSGADSVFIGVYPNPATPVVSPNGIVDHCGSGPVTLSTAADNAVTFQWTNHGKNISGATQNSYVADSTGEYLVMAVSSHHCIAGSDSVAVNIHPSPHVTFTLALDSFCLYSAPILLSGGSPVGGYYSGTYVINDVTFNQTASDTGSFKVYYTYNDSIGCTGKDSTKIHIYNCTTTGIESIGVQNTFEISPNPALAEVHITTTAQGTCTMRLFNLLGQEVGRQLFNGQITYAVEQLPGGVYLVEISDAANIWKTVKRLVVQ